MADIITTLHPDHEPDTNIYPNIKKDNIPNQSVDYTKIENGTLGFVTPEMFGAIGDGVNDDTNAFIECLNYKNIQLYGSKTYLIDGVLQISDNTILNGNNATLKFINVVTDIDQQDIDGSCIIINGNNVTIKDLNCISDLNWIKRPFTWDPDFSTWYNLRVKTKACFLLTNVGYLKIENVCCIGFRNHLIARNVYEFEISNCKSIEMLADGFFIGYGCENGIISNCYGEKTDDDFISITADGRYPNLPPHDIISNNNMCINCYGAFFCTEGSFNIQCTNGFASNMHFKPIKFGEFNVSGVIIPSGLQLFKNISILLDETIQGDNNGNLESVACGLGANVNIVLDNIHIEKPIDNKEMQFYINGGNVVIKNSIFNGGRWWYRALSKCVIDNTIMKSNGQVIFTGDYAIVKNCIFEKEQNYSGNVSFNTTKTIFTNNTFDGYTETYPLVSTSTDFSSETFDRLDGNSVTTIKNDTINISARVAPSKLENGFVWNNGKLYACIGGNKYVVTTTYEQ